MKKVQEVLINKTRSGYVLQYRTKIIKNQEKKSLIIRISDKFKNIENSWNYRIPVYKTIKEAKQALKIEIERTQKFNPEIKFVLYKKED